MSKLLYATLTSLCSMPSIEWSTVKHSALKYVLVFILQVHNNASPRFWKGTFNKHILYGHDIHIFLAKYSVYTFIRSVTQCHCFYLSRTHYLLILDNVIIFGYIPEVYCILCLYSQTFIFTLRSLNPFSSPLCFQIHTYRYISLSCFRTSSIVKVQFPSWALPRTDVLPLNSLIISL